jgi:2-succinyl-6-hydroxy-2,4-cyclohexadiene-1-carboxylate synthase
MKQLRANDIDWHYEEWGDAAQPTLLLLHGFTGSSQSWAEFVKLLKPEQRIVAVDLPGHGKTPLPDKSFSLSQLADALAEFILGLKLAPVVLLGYSMGGRIALHVALQYQELLSALILIGASPGIADLDERKKRKRLDNLLAESIRQKGMEWFADFWEQQPIFATQQRLLLDQRARVRTQRLKSNPEGLAYALEQWSPGCQENLLPKMSELNIPILLLAGEQDSKYRKQNEKILTQFPKLATNIIVPNAGHAVQVEQPEVTAKLINIYLQKIRK